MKSKEKKIWKMQEIALIMSIVVFMVIATMIHVTAVQAADLNDVNEKSTIENVVEESTNIIKETTKPTYIEVPIEKVGIDVSKWNGKIDWQSVKDSGIDYAIIRVGYGSDISSQDDPYAKYNMDECTRLGIPFGVYIYSYATNLDKAQSEANHVLRMIQGYNLSYPIYFDLEDKQIASLGSETLGQITSVFCSTIQNAGYSVGVYSNTSWFNNILTDSVFDNYTRWCAQYNTSCQYQGAYTMWQYTEKGQVSGIATNVDMNISYETTLIEQ